MNRSLSFVFVLAFAPFVAACGTTEAAPSPVAPKPVAASTADSRQALCVEVFTKNRTCTDAYIPALVDLRAKYDMPKGIAAEVTADRAAIIAQAKQEWAGDSTDEAIAGTCTNIASHLDDSQRADAEAARACLTKQDCGDYTACIMPFFEKRFAK